MNVPGFESLAWSGDHVQVHDDMRAQRVRLARMGDVSSADGGVLLFAYDSPGGLRIGRLVAGGPEVALQAVAPTPTWIEMVPSPAHDGRGDDPTGSTERS